MNIVLQMFSTVSVFDDVNAIIFHVHMYILYLINQSKNLSVRTLILLYAGQK